jgi:UDP-N-acetyl-2-amino-2-deoxyglucuronate dehydrogenase
VTPGAEALHLAIVGCGSIVRAHLRGIEDGAGGRVRVTAAVDPDAAAASAVASRVVERLGGDRPLAAASWAEAVDGAQVDAALVAVPHHLHEALALEVLAAGRHLLLEKPMAPTLDGCARILDAATAAGTVLMVGETAQYWPEVLAAAELLAGGAIGDVITAQARVWTPPLPEYYATADAWRLDERAGGGIAIDTGSHWIRPLRMWLGEMTEVVGVVGHPFGGMAGESLVRALCRHDSGVVSSLDLLVTGAPQPMSPLFRITGSAGELTVEMDGTVRVFDAAAPGGRVAASSGGYFAGFAGEWADFCAAVLDGAPPAAPPASAARDLAIALAIYRSAASRRFERVEVVRDGGGATRVVPDEGHGR